MTRPPGPCARRSATGSSSGSPLIRPSRSTPPSVTPTSTTSASAPYTRPRRNPASSRSDSSWSATPPRTCASRGSRSAGSIRHAGGGWPPRAPSAWPWCARPATRRTRAPPPRRCAGHLSGRPWVGKRSRKRRAEPASAPRPAAAPAPARQSRSEAKNAAVRAQLEPLEQGERPRAVTVGAAVATVLAVGNVVLYIAGVKVSGQKPKVQGIAGPTLIMAVCAYGMWRAKYWAVLGMEALLGLVIIIFALLLATAENLQAVLISVAVIGASGWLFWKLVKAMARIQMPKRPEPRG